MIGPAAAYGQPLRGSHKEAAMSEREHSLL
jgi:hypothetical protein